MKKRWDAKVEATNGEVVTLVVKGATEEEATKNVKGYAGIKEIISVTERIVERTFPSPPSHLVDIHYRPLKRTDRTDGKVIFG